MRELLAGPMFLLLGCATTGSVPKLLEVPANQKLQLEARETRVDYKARYLFYRSL